MLNPKTIVNGWSVVRFMPRTVWRLTVTSMALSFIIIVTAMIEVYGASSLFFAPATGLGTFGFHSLVLLISRHDAKKLDINAGLHFTPHYASFQSLLLASFCVLGWVIAFVFLIMAIVAQAGEDWAPAGDIAQDVVQLVLVIVEVGVLFFYMRKCSRISQAVANGGEVPMSPTTPRPKKELDQQV